MAHPPDQYQSRPDDLSNAAVQLLPGGIPCRIRQLGPGDRRLVSDMYAALSDRSRRDRFQTSPPQLPENYLRLLVDDVDQTDHVALLALVPAGSQAERPVGVGRIVRYRSAPASADIAVTVVDAWQRRGVGLALARLLVRRRPSGVSRLVTTVSAANAAALALLARLGTVALVADGHGTYEVTVELPSPVASQE